MEHSRNEGLNYIKSYPKLKKWINQCVVCGIIGYDPDLPEKLTRNLGSGEFNTVSAAHIRSHFQPMAVNELGICEQCQKIINRENN